jgi:N-acetylneuraminate synthase/N,N'-diacetyllegionaminate synthase
MTESNRFAATVLLGDRPVMAGAPCVIVAEIGPNHNGDPAQAHALIDAAAATGCDAVKFQYRIADAEIFDRTTKSYYYDESRYAFIKRVQELPHSLHAELRDHARQAELIYICSVFCEEAVDKVAELDPGAIKIPSGEVSNPWLLERAGAVGRPVIASSGMSPLDEIDSMMRTLAAVTDQVILLHCLSEYPTRLADMHLRMIPLLKERYGCPVGLSDHSRRIREVAAVAALGSCMIEVHFTFDRRAAGPDHRVSVLPGELSRLVRSVRDLEIALGSEKKVLGQHVQSVRKSFTNSIVARRTLKLGEIIEPRSLALKKPGTGLDARHLPDLLGRRLTRDVAAGAPLSLEDVT